MKTIFHHVPIGRTFDANSETWTKTDVDSAASLDASRIVLFAQDEPVFLRPTEPPAGAAEER